MLMILFIYDFFVFLMIVVSLYVVLLVTILGLHTEPCNLHMMSFFPLCKVSSNFMQRLRGVTFTSNVDRQTDRVILIYPQTMLSGLIDKNNKQIIFFLFMDCKYICCQVTICILKCLCSGYCTNYKIPVTIRIIKERKHFALKSVNECFYLWSASMLRMYVLMSMFWLLSEF